MINPKMCSVASCVSAPMGVRRVKTNGTNSTSGSSAAAAMKPASVDCEEAYSAWIASAFCRIPERCHKSRLAGTPEKVFDSCW